MSYTCIFQLLKNIGNIPFKMKLLIKKNKSINEHISISSVSPVYPVSPVSPVSPSHCIEFDIEELYQINKDINNDEYWGYYYDFESEEEFNQNE